MNRRLVVPCSPLVAAPSLAARRRSPRAPKPKPPPPTASRERDREDRRSATCTAARRQIMQHGAGDRHGQPLRPRPAGRGHLLPQRPQAVEPQDVTVSKGKGGSGAFSARIRIDARPASTRPAPSHVATAELGGDSTVRKSWRVSFPSLHQGQCGDVVKRLQEGDGEDGLHRQRRPLLRRQDRPRGARLPQSQRHDPQLARRQGPGQARLRRPGRLPGPPPGRRRARSRRRSPSRSSSSPRATSRSRSTRSPPASPRPRR